MKRTECLARKARLTPQAYLALCLQHFRGYWKLYLSPIAFVFLLQSFVRIDVNYTNSLPDHVFVTVKGWKAGLQRGDYVAFAFPTEHAASPFRRGDHMVKVIMGTEGDRIGTSEDRSITIYEGDASKALSLLGGQEVGKAKVLSREGAVLDIVAAGTIPPGHYYVGAPHPDSLDSRYAMVGLITSEHIIGRTFPLF